MFKASTRPAIRFRCVLLALACGGLAACGHSGSGTAPAAPAAAAAAAPRTPHGPADDLVQAVSSGQDENLDLRFAVREKPVAGRPVDITVQLTPRTDLEHLTARVHVDDGLTLRSGAELPPLDHPQRDQPVQQEIVAMPARDGIYTIMVTVTAELGSGSLSRTFAIPLMVGPVQSPP